MAEQMLFPETWEEFEKQFGFYDIRQAYTFGNTRLIPSFRVEQWLYHLDYIKRKKQLQKNKMEQVVRLFGKKLDEEFKVKYGDSLGFEAAVKFTKKNFRVKHLPFQDYWSWDNELLADLLAGRAVIVDDSQ